MKRARCWKGNDSVYSKPRQELKLLLCRKHLSVLYPIQMHNTTLRKPSYLALTSQNLDWIPGSRLYWIKSCGRVRGWKIKPARTPQCYNVQKLWAFEITSRAMMDAQTWHGPLPLWKGKSLSPIIIFKSRPIADRFRMDEPSELESSSRSIPTLSNKSPCDCRMLWWKAPRNFFPHELSCQENSGWTSGIMRRVQL